MASPIKNVIVIGAGGNTGPSIVNSLLASGFTVSILARESSTSTFPAGLAVHRTDYSPASLLSAFNGQDAVVSVITTFSTSQQKVVIDAAAEAGVKRFLPSEYGLDTSRADAIEEAPPVVMKRDAVERLRSKEGQGMSWTAVCVGIYFDWALELGFMGWSIPTRSATIYNGGTSSYSATNLARIGEAVSAVLLHPAETANQYVYVHSFAVTQQRVLAALEASTGAKFAVTEAQSEELKKEGLAALEKGDEAVGLMKTVGAAVYGPKGLFDFGGRAEEWMKVLGLEEENLEEVVGKIVKKVDGKV
ncbi:NmrA-like family protein [Aulographum hederae CBS 113979]|uniref:NmrA-like family protein n=1 Tax=Aulographum hederae CBS 113979 TaxID=1176131 RepID=A0A6G1GKG6_9PEZI|nr:NmrA-like family protein [Aulographum hederae CBS 113979]